MNEYLAGMVARSEHELMKQSLAPVYDFDERGEDRSPRRLSKWLGKLFQLLGSALTSLGTRMSHEQQLPRGLSDHG